MNEVKKLKEENEELKALIERYERKIAIVKTWMEKEVRTQAHKIAKQKTKNMTSSLKESFLKENIEEVISNRIYSYFWELLLLNAPKWTIESITTAEINFYNMQQNPTIDGFWVISWYHKVLDLFIESFITNNFRKFAKKKGCTILRVNDPLEKSLNLVVNKKYILSVWRLYWLLKMIKEDASLDDYGECFRDYLDKYSDLKEVLLSDLFFNKFTNINKSWILWSKRHSWQISFEETKKARRVLIWEFRDETSMIYKLLETQSVI